MHIVLIGCEYSGTTTLAYAISKWAKSVTGERVGFHDHWKIPHVNHPPFETPEENDAAFLAWSEGKGEDPTRLGFTEEEQGLFLALKPNQQEMFERYHMEYHISSGFYSYDHHNIVGMHIDEAVYAGLYYGYGGDGEYADRKMVARRTEEHMVAEAPDSVLALCQAPADTIRQRMKDSPHQNGLLQEKDVDFVVGRFEEEHELSLIKNKFTVDTGTKSVDESLAEFVEKFEPFITNADRNKILVHKAKQRGEWV